MAGSGVWLTLAWVVLACGLAALWRLETALLVLATPGISVLASTGGEYRRHFAGTRSPSSRSMGLALAWILVVGVTVRSLLEGRSIPALEFVAIGVSCCLIWLLGSLRSKGLKAIGVFGACSCGLLNLLFTGLFEGLSLSSPLTPSLSGAMILFGLLGVRVPQTAAWLILPVAVFHTVRSGVRLEDFDLATGLVYSLFLLLPAVVAGAAFLLCSGEGVRSGR